MEVHTSEARFSTQGDGDAVDITSHVQGSVEEVGIAAGQATAFVRGSTAAVTTMEYEPGGKHDLKAMLERLIPPDGDYEHNPPNHDTHPHPHQRAPVIRPPPSGPPIGGAAGP